MIWAFPVPQVSTGTSRSNSRVILQFTIYPIKLVQALQLFAGGGARSRRILAILRDGPHVCRKGLDGLYMGEDDRHWIEFGVKGAIAISASPMPTIGTGQITGTST